MSNLKGFWSYVHKDDENEGGRISQLARDVVKQYELLTGETIELFLDRDSIEWGDDWKDKIDENLASIGFFVPVLSPGYFMSAECRRELQFFARRATELGVKDLVLPILYVDVPAFQDENAGDLIKLIKKFQWENWRDLRFEDRDSGEYRRSVARLANRIVEANRQAENTVIIDLKDNEDKDETVNDDSPGLIDAMATFEEKADELPKTLELITEDINLIGQYTNESADKINKISSNRKGFSTKLIIAGKLASQLTDPAERIWTSSNMYASHLHDYDVVFRLLIEKSIEEAETNPESLASTCEFFNSVQLLSVSGNESIISFQSMIDSSAPLTKLSRDLRPSLRRLKQGLTILIESTKIINEWVKLIEESGIVCNGEIE